MPAYQFPANPFLRMESFLIDVPVPSMGATVNEMTVIDLLVAPGARIAKGQKVAELESDKSVFDFEAPCDGTVVAVKGRAGDILPSGAPFLSIETSDASLKHLEVKDAARAAEARAVAHAPATAVSAGSPAEAAAKASHHPSSSGSQWTPRALKLAQEAGLDPAALTAITATGPGGRISGDDVAQFLAARGATKSHGPGPAAAGAAGGFQALAGETVCVAGIGFAVPKSVRPNRDILVAFPHMTEAEVVKLTGIQERRYAAEDETATDLAATAVQHALAQAHLHVNEIDGIIMATLLPDQPVPSAASALAKQLGITRALAFDLNAACAGWLYALEVGRTLIRSGTAKKLLVVTAELLSRITNPKDQNTAFLFGDGAGAAVLTAASGGHRLNHLELSGDATHYEAIQRTGGGALRPVPMPNGDDMHHFYLQMNGSVVFKHAVIAFGDIIEHTLQRHHLKPDEIQWIVPHQANERILKAVSKRVGIPFEKFVVTIGKYGNTSAASISMALGWAAEEGIFHSGDKIIFCAVGAGFTYASGLLTW